MNPLLRSLAMSLLALLSLPAAAALSVTREADEIVVSADAEVDADVAQAWRVLTGYDDLARFIPGMIASRTVRRSGDEAVVEQQGRAGFGPFAQAFALTLDVHERPLRSVEATAVAGDFERFASRYELVALDAHRTRIVYHAVLKPRLPVPLFIGVPLMRGAIREQFEALIAEVEAQGRRS